MIKLEVLEELNEEKTFKYVFNDARGVMFKLNLDNSIEPISIDESTYLILDSFYKPEYRHIYRELTEEEISKISIDTFIDVYSAYSRYYNTIAQEFHHEEWKLLFNS